MPHYCHTVSQELCRHLLHYYSGVNKKGPKVWTSWLPCWSSENPGLPNKCSRSRWCEELYKIFLSFILLFWKNFKPAVKREYYSEYSTYPAFLQIVTNLSHLLYPFLHRVFCFFFNLNYLEVLTNAGTWPLNILERIS